MSSIDVLEKMTQIALEAIWKIQIQECIDASISPKTFIYTAKDTNYDNLLYIMEEGMLPPKPKDLPMPPPAWLV